MAHIYWFYGEEILACSRKLHEVISIGDFSVGSTNQR